MRRTVAFVMKKLTEDEVIAIIRKEVEATSGRAVAKRIGVSDSYISDILAGKRPVSDSIAFAYGFEREITTEVTFSKIA